MRVKNGRSSEALFSGLQLVLLRVGAFPPHRVFGPEQPLLAEGPPYDPAPHRVLGPEQPLLAEGADGDEAVKRLTEVLRKGKESRQGKKSVQWGGREGGALETMAMHAAPPFPCHLYFPPPLPFPRHPAGLFPRNIQETGLRALLSSPPTP